MKYSNLRRSVMDGCFCFFFFIILFAIITSDFAYSFSLIHNLLISVLFAVLRILVYLFFLKKETNYKKNFWFSIGSTGIFVLCLLVCFALQLTFPVKLFMRELNNADGISIIVNMTSYILSALILKIFGFVILLIKNNRHQSRNH